MLNIIIFICGILGIIGFMGKIVIEDRYFFEIPLCIISGLYLIMMVIIPMRNLV